MFAWLLATAGLLLGVGVLVLVGLRASAFAILLGGIAGLLLLGGVTAGSTVYRTVFFVPHFTSGVAVYILWKKLYNPTTGPINTALAAPLTAIGNAVNTMPAGLVRGGLVAALALLVLVAAAGLRRLAALSREGALGTAAALLPAAMLILPAGLAVAWSPAPGAARTAAALVGAIAITCLLREWRHGRDFLARPGQGFGDAFMLAAVLMLLQIILLGAGIVCHHLPDWSRKGLEPPAWLSVYAWAKPAIMIMGLWGAIGSNNMLLYIAGLSHIPSDLYEAADIDGASRFQRFWHITWPQLAPVTFFIFIMSVIGGLQGGFEMARTMTNGGPAGATTTLSFFIYNQGFGTGRLGYASGIAWTLFAMVFTVTVFNWKFGSRYVND